MKIVSTQELLERLQRWAGKVSELGSPSVHVFGSLVYRNGTQFGESSDVDLVVTLPNLEDAVARHRWVEELGNLKAALELELMQFLVRQADEPIVSVVAVTDAEISCDVHKDGHRAFFSENTFVNLADLTPVLGLPGAGTAQADRFFAAAVGFAQKIRNEFLAVSPNTTARLLPHIHIDDAMPKRFMRAGAMANRAAGAPLDPGAEHDLQLGLDAVFHRLNDLRKAHSTATRTAGIKLHDLISVRRRARGHVTPVTASDQLLLAEVIYDMAVTGLVPPATGDAPPAGPSAPPAPRPVGGAGAVRLAAPSPEPGNDANTDAGDLPLEGALYRASPMSHSTTTAFFSDRFKRAFPGIREIEWFDDPAEATTRLMTLLKVPLVFSDATPIWWWRGGNLQIERFEPCGDDVVLMNYEELKVARIAAVPGSSYKRSFVYVETEAMDPTGLYRTRPEDIDAEVRQYGYASEEYGLFRGKHRLTRGEYDDGGAIIDGVLTETYGDSALRIRYLTPYNFVIAANGSPINNSSFDHELETLLNRALDGDRKSAIDTLAEQIEQLPIREFGSQ
jgi:predicted nucleotidyltransferase